MGLFDQEFSRRDFLKAVVAVSGWKLLTACTPSGVLQPEIDRLNIAELIDPEAVPRSSNLRMLSADLGALEPMPVDLTPEMLNKGIVTIFHLTPEQALAANMSPSDTMLPMLQLTEGPNNRKFIPLGIFKEDYLAGPLSREPQHAQLRQSQALRLIFADPDVGINLDSSGIKGKFRIQTEQGHMMIDNQSGVALRIIEARPDSTKPINNGRVAVQVTMPDGNVYYGFTSKGIVPDVDPQSGKPLHYTLRHGRELGQDFPDLFKQNYAAASTFQEFATNKPGQTLKPLMLIDIEGQTTFLAEVKSNGKTQGIATLIYKKNGNLDWFHGFEMDAARSNTLGVATPGSWNDAMTIARQYAEFGGIKNKLRSIQCLDETGKPRQIQLSELTTLRNEDIFTIWKKSGTRVPTQLPRILTRLSSSIQGLNMLLPLADLAPIFDGNDPASALEATMARLAPDTLTFKDGNRAEINLDTLFSTRGTDYGRILINDGGLVAVRTDMDPTCPLAFAALPLDNGRLGISVKILNSASSVKEYAAGTPAAPLDANDRTPASYFPEELYVMMPWDAADGYTMSESEYQQRIQAFLENGEVQPFPIHEVYNRYMDTNGLVEDARYLITPIHFADGTNKLFIYNQRKAKLVA